MRPMLVAVIITYASIAGSIPADGKARDKWGAGLPRYISCDTVRDFASRYTVAELRVMARKAGFKITAKQVAQANNCKRGAN